MPSYKAAFRPSNSKLSSFKDSKLAQSTRPAVFTPNNEPYLGRELLHHFDKVIPTVLQQNQLTASQTHGAELTDHQRMACIVIPQAVSLALSIRELIRQGYLFGAHVLVRPLIERAVILLYLRAVPTDIEKWKRGWHVRDDAPSLSKMLEAIQRVSNRSDFARGADLTAALNSLLHGKPESAQWNTIALDDGSPGYASSKILERPDLCDEVCANTLPWLVITMAMMAAYFPDTKPLNPGVHPTAASGRG